jgi:hypothetical protein
MAERVTAQMRRAVAAVGRQDRRDLGYRELIDRGLDHHFTCKLYSCCLEVEAKNSAALEATKPTMKIAARAVEKEPSESREQGIAEISVQQRHGSRPDAALKAIAHDELITVAKLLDKWIEFSEIVTIVRVAHYDEPAAGSLYARTQGVAIPS